MTGIMKTNTSIKEQFLPYKRAFEECIDKDSFNRGFLLSAIQLNTDMCWAKLTDELQHKFKVFKNVLAAYRSIGDKINFQDLYGYGDEVVLFYKDCLYSTEELEEVMDKARELYHEATENEKSWFDVEFMDIDGLNAKIDETIAFMKKTPEGENLISPKLITKNFKKLTSNL